MAKRHVPGLRWWIIGLIATATVINYIDRTSLAVMWPDISKELDLSKDQYATIVASFMIAYALGQALSGRLFDWVGTRMGFVLSIFVWSVSCGLHGIARGIASFSFFRSMLGLSEAGNWPGATKASAEWFPIKERAFAQGIFNAGASLGAVMSAPLIAFLYLWLGWKATFVVVASSRKASQPSAPEGAPASKSSTRPPETGGGATTAGCVSAGGGGSVMTGAEVCAAATGGALACQR